MTRQRAAEQCHSGHAGATWPVRPVAVKRRWYAPLPQLPGQLSLVFARLRRSIVRQPLVLVPRQRSPERQPPAIALLRRLIGRRTPAIARTLPWLLAPRLRPPAGPPRFAAPER